MKKLITLILTASLLLTSLVSCINPSNGAKMTIGVMSGPTGMGMAKLMSDNSNSTEKYAFEVYSSPDEATSDLASKELDLLCLPTNTAANLYNENSDFVSVLAINTLGSLYLLASEGTTVSSVEDLEGKTIYTSVAGSTTVPILNTILEKNNVNATVEVEADHDALVLKIANNEVSLAVLPEPKVTAALIKNSSYTIALDLSEEWSKVSDNALTMGCIVVRKEFLNAHEGAVVRFLAEYKESIGYISNPDNLDSAAQMIVDAEVLPQLPVAKKALKNLGDSIAYLDGEQMKKALVEFYGVLLETMPGAIGGQLPADGFYYGA